MSEARRAEGGHAFGRGDVVSLPRGIGFGRGEALELFVVLQSEMFAAALPTLVVAPLDDAHAVYAGFPGAVPVKTTGARAREMVILVPNLRSVRVDRLEGKVQGRLDRKQLAAVDRVLRLLLDMT